MASEQAQLADSRAFQFLRKVRLTTPLVTLRQLPRFPRHWTALPNRLEENSSSYQSTLQPEEIINVVEKFNFFL